MASVTLRKRKLEGMEKEEKIKDKTKQQLGNGRLKWVKCL